MDSSRMSASFAPYTPPPDDPSVRESFAHKASSSRLGVAAQAPFSGMHTSYQAGGVPTFGTSLSSGELDTREQTHINPWETTYGMRLDVLAAFAYLLGPISAFVLLVLETRSDYIRFHAYQSALLTTPLILLRIFGSLTQFPSWLLTFITLSIVATSLFMSYQAYCHASRSRLTRFQLPYIGTMAERWVAEE